MKMTILVPLYDNAENIDYVENIKTEIQNKKVAVSRGLLFASVTYGIHKEGKSFERRVCEVVHPGKCKVVGRKIGALINLDNIAKKNIETILNEISYTDHLQCELDYGNKNVFKNFKLFLVMEPE
jgi:hypothetical protein